MKTLSATALLIAANIVPFATAAEEDAKRGLRGLPENAVPTASVHAGTDTLTRRFLNKDGGNATDLVAASGAVEEVMSIINGLAGGSVAGKGEDEQAGNGAPPFIGLLADSEVAVAGSFVAIEEDNDGDISVGVETNGSSGGGTGILEGASIGVAINLVEIGESNSGNIEVGVQIGGGN